MFNLSEQAISLPVIGVSNRSPILQQYIQQYHSVSTKLHIIQTKCTRYLLLQKSMFWNFLRSFVWFFS